MSSNNSNKNPFKVHKTFETGNKRKAAGDLSPEEGVLFIDKKILTVFRGESRKNLLFYVKNLLK